MTFHKYPKIKVLGHEENKDIFKDPNDVIIIQEKVDGANFRFMIKEGKLIVGSRTQELQPNIEHKFEKNFRRCIEYVNEQTKDKELQEGLIYYGECMVKHTMNYDWDKMPPFLGFDIYDITKQSFIPWPINEALFTSIRLQTVPIIMSVKSEKITEVNDDLVPKAHYACPTAKDQKAEGIVFKNYEKKIFAKYVRDVFKEKNSEVFGGSPKYNKTDETNNAEIVFKFCTNARIDKMIFKLLDEGKELDMPLMKELPNRVYDDIMEEEWRYITQGSHRLKIDFGALRKLVTKRCLAVLRQVITNNALNNEEGKG